MKQLEDAAIAAFMCSVSAMAWTAAPCTAQSTASLAVEIGVSPEGLVVAGIGTQEVAMMLLRMQDATTERGHLIVAHEEVQAAIAQVTLLTQLLWSDPENLVLAEDLEDAEDALDMSRAWLLDCQEELRDVAFDGVEPSELEMISLFHANQARRVPSAFRVLSRSVAEWEAIEIALQVEARATRRSEPVPPEAADLLAAWRIDSDVVQAQDRLNEDLLAMQQVFNSH